MGPLREPSEAGRWGHRPLRNGHHCRRASSASLRSAPSPLGRFPLSGGNVERSETKGVGIIGPYETDLPAAGPLPPQCVHWGTSPGGGGWRGPRRNS